MAIAHRFQLSSPSHLADDGDIFRRLKWPASHLSVRFRASSELMGIFPLGKKKLMHPMRVLYVKEQNLSSYESIKSLLCLCNNVKFVDNHEKPSTLCCSIIGMLCGFEEVKTTSFKKALALTNLLMLIMPLEVLAETCEASNSFLKMPLLLAVALIGAAVGGSLARRRRNELQRLNDQLRQINEALRRQAKIESYAPTLSYAPVGRYQQEKVVVDPRKQELHSKLRTGKNFLRNQEPEKAYVEFNTAFQLAESLGDQLELKKAVRGLGASLQRLGRYREAIKYYSKVLEISRTMGDDSGSTEAYGAIADCYTELGDLERAAKFYDTYIARLESE